MAENELKVNRERGIDMAKQNWKPGNMLYPVPAVMVSCQRPGEKPNIVTIAWACIFQIVCIDTDRTDIGRTAS